MHKSIEHAMLQCSEGLPAAVFLCCYLIYSITHEIIHGLTSSQPHISCIIHHLQAQFSPQIHRTAPAPAFLGWLRSNHRAQTRGRGIIMILYGHANQDYLIGPMRRAGTILSRFQERSSARRDIFISLGESLGRLRDR
ncbi:hypothetical protein IQ06DRAFT_35076 [Phaeosphaeriaceae sp. SRC1lsM3a]|nr:hypothetical protein IQ06DRAFT_35076 [Stagonospora sp. SRC1lsM3a]